MRPILAGRQTQKAVGARADALGTERRVFALEDGPSGLAHQLSGVAALVLHCAGPFSATAEPMMEACLAAGVSIPRHSPARST